MMRTYWIYTLCSVLLVSLVSLLGIAFLSLDEKKLHATLFLLVSLAAGALLGDAFLHLLPHSFEQVISPSVSSFFALLGILAFFILEKFLRWRHQHRLAPADEFRPIGYINLLADAVHNLIDGALIGASYLISPQTGIATTLAVLLHEIPQEIGDFAVLLQSGFSRRRAILFNFLSALCALVGAAGALLAGAAIESIIHMMLPFTAGGFIYIAVGDLLPELQKERLPARSLAQLAALLAGIGLMQLLTLVE